ncbi:AP2 domain-containing protein [Staphylococcus saprophyticus]|nr:AP2 domain-containing protein [Staphylococcus saprophyticus]
MVKSIYLQDGEEIFVDDEDYERVSQHTWSKQYSKEVRVVLSKINGVFISLNNFLENNSFQKIKNNDFTKTNLTTKGNKSRWKRASLKSISKYKGVSWIKQQNKWAAYINVDKKNKFLGSYTNEDDAAKAYNQAVLDYWGGEGYSNIIGEDNRLTLSNYKTNKKTNRSRGGKWNYRGVSKTNLEKYRASVYFGGKNNFTDGFTTTEKAALAYNKCAIYLHGDDAILNDVPINDELKEFIDNWEIPEKIKALKEGATSE